MRLESSSSVLLTLTLFISLSALPAASTTLGKTDALRCYQESMYAFSNQGIRYCNNAINGGELTRRDLAATYSNRGIIHLKNGKYEKALQDHDRAVELKPDIPQVHINRGNALYYAHEYEEALTEYDIAITINAEPIVASLFNKALTLIKLHRMSEAKTTLETALEADPNSKRIKSVLKDVASLSESFR